MPRSRRFYIYGVTGFRINPKSLAKGNASDPPSTSWSVLDRDNMHLEVATFEPNGGRTSDNCKMFAQRLADKLNKEEDAWLREQKVA